MNGTTAEWRIGTLLSKTPMVKRLTPDKNDLLAIADPVRVITVSNHIFHEEGYHITEASPRLILDRLWATDFLVTHKGYRIAIDLTIDPDKTESKLTKLKDLWSTPPLDIDALVVWVLDPTDIPKSLENALGHSHKSGIVYI